MTKKDRLRVMELIGALGDIRFLDKEGDTDTESVAIFKKLAKKLYIESIGGAYNLKGSHSVIADMVVAMVNKYFLIDLTDRKRIGVNIRARKLACLLLKSYTALSYNEIGAFVLQGQADHTTIMYHVKTGSKLIATNNAYKFDFEVITNMIDEQLAYAKEAA